MVEFVEEKVSDIKNNSSKEKSSIEDILKESCLIEVNERIYYLKQRGTSSSRIKILESKQFYNTQDTIDYLHKWGFKEKPGFFESLSQGVLPYNDLYETQKYENIREYDDLTIVVIKAENRIEGTEVAITIPLLCLNGELTENSAKNF